jgi:hypothetical protein
MKYKTLPSQERLNALFEYSVISGEVTRKSRPSPTTFKCKEGQKVGTSKCRQGYRRVRVDGTPYQLHRLIWKLVTGEDPGELVIDHIDGDGSHNAWHNLRIATQKQNNSNCRSRTSSSGLRGAYRNPKSGKYYSQVSHHGTEIYLGTFDTAEEANAAHVEARLKLNGEFARL